MLDQSKMMRLERRVDRFKLAAFVQEWLCMTHYEYTNRAAGADAIERFEIEVFFKSVNEKTERLIGRSGIHDWRFIFDETVWPPEDNRHGKRGVLYVKPVPSASFFMFIVDFDKPIDQCVMMRGHNPIGEMSDIEVNVFHVYFYDPENPFGD